MAGSKNPQRSYPVLEDTRVLGWCKECVGIMKQIGYPMREVDWRTTSRKNSSWFGMAYKKYNLIVLNHELIHEDETVVKNTILHELAHLVSPVKGHGACWQAICDRIRDYTGQVITRTSSFSKHAAVQAVHESSIKYEFVCPECGCRVRLKRKSRFVDEYDQLSSNGTPRWWCARCRKTNGKKVAFNRVK